MMPPCTALFSLLLASQFLSRPALADSAVLAGSVAACPAPGSCAPRLELIWQGQEHGLQLRQPIAALGSSAGLALQHRRRWLRSTWGKWSLSVHGTTGLGGGWTAFIGRGEHGSLLDLGLELELTWRRHDAHISLFASSGVSLSHRGDQVHPEQWDWRHPERTLQLRFKPGFGVRLAPVGLWRASRRRR